MTCNYRLISIVEGAGDEAAVPELLRRVLWERLCRYDIDVTKAISTHGKANLKRKLQQFLHYALKKGCEAILVVLDADVDCPIALAVELATAASRASLGIPVAIVCANREYEAWFICNLTATHGGKIRERLNLASSLTSPNDIERLRDPKGWLTGNMPRERAYKETFDQTPLTHQIDLDLTYGESRSFRRLCDAIGELVGALDEGAALVTPECC